MERSITDEEIVQRIIENDDNEAIQLLLVRYENECRKIVYYRLKKLPANQKYDIDEFMQIVRLTTVSIIKKYDRARGSFHSYWSCAVNRIITSEIRRVNSKSRSLEISQSCFFKEEYNDDFLENMSDNSVLIRDQLDVEDTLLQIQDISNEHFTDLEKKVFAYHLAGFSYKEIAQKIKSTPKKVDNLMMGIRKKIKNYL